MDGMAAQKPLPLLGKRWGKKVKTSSVLFLSPFSSKKKYALFSPL